MSSRDKHPPKKYAYTFRMTAKDGTDHGTVIVGGDTQEEAESCVRSSFDRLVAQGYPLGPGYSLTFVKREE